MTADQRKRVQHARNLEARARLDAIGGKASLERRETLLDKAGEPGVDQARRPPTRITAAHRHAIRELRAQGVSYDGVAGRLGLSYGAVYNAARAAA